MDYGDIDKGSTRLRGLSQPRDWTPVSKARPIFIIIIPQEAPRYNIYKINSQIKLIDFYQ